MSITAYSDYGTDDAPAGPGPTRARWSRRVAIDVVAGIDTHSFLAGSALATL